MIQPLLIQMMMKMRWTIYLKALAVKLIGSSFVKQQIVKNITGLHNAKFRISPLIVHCDFPLRCSLKKKTASYLLTASYLFLDQYFFMLEFTFYRTSQKQ